MKKSFISFAIIIALFLIFTACGDETSQVEVQQEVLKEAAPAQMIENNEKAAAKELEKETPAEEKPNENIEKTNENKKDETITGNKKTVGTTTKTIENTEKPLKKTKQETKIKTGKKIDTEKEEFKKTRKNAKDAFDELDKEFK